jgi:UDP-N-acetylglucosamine diphosphorylase / glucose-1-phosphate thymidylyltransferase / UDP-N-acetylgalactosamine diphosphorylase / glucosamine-1-phosphate N-acetyltransferase / galactosamine-1-phosphate N-acetyltransferase
MRVCLFEDRGVVDLEPLTLTRPAFELLCGRTSLAHKQAHHFRSKDVGALVQSTLVELCGQQAGHSPVNDFDWLRAGPTVLVNARWLPGGALPDLSRPNVGTVGDEVAYAVVGPDLLTCCSANSLAESLMTWTATLPRHEAGGRLFRRLWELVSANGEEIVHDWEAARPHPKPADTGLAIVGPRDRACIDPSARIDPFVVLDTTGGPVIVEREAIVLPFSRLEGPCCIGPRTQVQGAKVRGGTTLGPECRIGGEVEASIVQGFSNKYHDGFLGHAYVGEWVNLGAGTSNSDLRNDYGEVTVTVNGQPVPTGQSKVGCFRGDHTKAGLGTLLNTGTSAGVFCNLLPTGGLLPKYVPSFASCWNGSLTDRANLDESLRTAATVMARRGQSLTEAHVSLYRNLFEQTGVERRRAVREAEARRLRRSA